jgi:hypothetical protein
MRTPLEQHIYDEVLKQLPIMIDNIKAQDFKGTIAHPIMIDGCIDSVVFDGEKAEPLYVEYRYAIGETMELLGSSVYCDEYEIRKIYFANEK